MPKENIERPTLYMVRCKIVDENNVVRLFDTGEIVDTFLENDEITVRELTKEELEKICHSEKRSD